MSIMDRITLLATSHRRRIMLRSVLLILMFEIFWFFILPTLKVKTIDYLVHQYVNGTVTAMDWQINWSQCSLIATEIHAVNDTNALEMFRADTITVQLSGWFEPRVETVTIDGLRLVFWINDMGRDWTTFFRTDSAMSDVHALLPPKVVISNGIVWFEQAKTFGLLNSYQERHAVGYSGDITTDNKQSVFRFTGCFNPESIGTRQILFGRPITDAQWVALYEHHKGEYGGAFTIRGDYDATVEALTQMEISGSYSDTRGNAIQADIFIRRNTLNTTHHELLFERAILTDGIDTLVMAGKMDDSGIAIQLAADSFSLCERYPDMPRLRGQRFRLTAVGTTERMSITMEFKSDDRQLTANSTLNAEWSHWLKTGRRDFEQFSIDGIWPIVGHVTAQGSASVYSSNPFGPFAVFCDTIYVQVPDCDLQIKGAGDWPDVFLLLGMNETTNRPVLHRASHIYVDTMKYRNYDISNVSLDIYPADTLPVTDCFKINVEIGSINSSIESWYRLSTRQWNGYTTTRLALDDVAAEFPAVLTGTGISNVEGTVNVVTEFMYCSNRNWQIRTHKPLNLYGLLITTNVYGRYTCYADSPFDLDITPERILLQNGSFKLPTGYGSFSAELSGNNYSRLCSLYLSLTPHDIRQGFFVDDGSEGLTEDSYNKFDRAIIERLMRKFLTRFPVNVSKLLHDLIGDAPHN